MITWLTVVHMVVCVLMIIVVLLQFGKGAEAGLLSDVGGSSILPQRGNILTKITTVLAICFLTLSLTLSILRGKESHKSVFDSKTTGISGSLADPQDQRKKVDPAPQAAPVAPNQNSAETK